MKTIDSVRERREVGQGIAALDAGWTFDGPVADTFVDHIRQSVPWYEVGHDLACRLSDYFVHQDSVCYEIGTSTGELLRKLALHHRAKPSVRWIGIDRVGPMIDKARHHCGDLRNVELVVDDVVTHAYERADLIVSYYTVQFVHPKRRQDLINRLYERLNWGGALLMFEKVRGPDARFQDMMISMYNDYKRQQGFEPEEILNKTASLKGVLEPFSREGNLGLLRRAGFSDIATFMKYICFEGFVAIK